MKVRLQFKPQDLWIGAYWEHKKLSTVDGSYDGIYTFIWICLLPCFPIKLEIYHGPWV